VGQKPTTITKALKGSKESYKNDTKVRSLLLNTKAKKKPNLTKAPQ